MLLEAFYLKLWYFQKSLLNEVSFVNHFWIYLFYINFFISNYINIKGKREIGLKMTNSKVISKTNLKNIPFGTKIPTPYN